MGAEPLHAVVIVPAMWASPQGRAQRVRWHAAVGDDVDQIAESVARARSSAWRRPATGTWPDWMSEWEIPFAETIDRAKKYVVSSTLSGVDWNAELVRGDLGQAVQRLKQERGDGLFVGGVTLPLALADLGLIDEYEFLVQPVLAGHGPTLLAGLRERIQLELVDRHEFRSGAVAVRYRPTRATA